MWQGRGYHPGTTGPALISVRARHGGVASSGAEVAVVASRSFKRQRQRFPRSPSRYRPSVFIKIGLSLALAVGITGVLTVIVPSPPASAAGTGTASPQTIINDATQWINQVPYCWDGGLPASGPSHGASEKKQIANGATDCLSDSTAGFDCTGLTEYAVYQASGGAINLAHSSDQLTSALKARGQLITTESSLQPGDLAFFGGTQSAITHVGIYVGGGNIVDANTAYSVDGTLRPDGVHEEPLSWQYPFVDGVRLPSVGLPSVSNFTVTPSSLSSSGGAVAFSAQVVNGQNCVLTVSKINYYDLMPPCDVSGQVSIPPNTKKNSVTYTFKLSVGGRTTINAVPVSVTVAGTGTEPTSLTGTTWEIRFGGTCGIMTFSNTDDFYNGSDNGTYSVSGTTLVEYVAGSVVAATFQWTNGEYYSPSASNILVVPITLIPGDDCS